MPHIFALLLSGLVTTVKMVSRALFSLCLNRARRSATFLCHGIRAGNSENFSAIATGHRAVCAAVSLSEVSSARPLLITTGEPAHHRYRQCVFRLIGYNHRTLQRKRHITQWIALSIFYRHFTCSVSPFFSFAAFAAAFHSPGPPLPA